MNRRIWRYIGFSLAVITWSLIMIWIHLWYPLLLNLILIDIFLTRKVDWTLRKYGLPRLLQSGIEWIFVIMVAIVLSFMVKVLFVEAYKIPTPSMEETLLAGDYIFVSKLAFGPKLPNTPLAIPFYHNQLPSGKKSYSERIKMPYKRLWGFSEVKRNDIIVFNFPEGDTMVVQYPGQNYYSLVRQYGREYIQLEFDIITHPVDKRENYVKRCIGLPGDTIQLIEGEIFVNGRISTPLPQQKFKYYVTTTGEPLPDHLLDSLKIPKSSVTYNRANSLHVIFLTKENIDKLRSYPAVRSMKRFVEPMLSFQNQEIFPHDENYRWTGDNFGPVRVPAKDDTIYLTQWNLPLYKRIIDVYESNDLKISGEEILLNGESVTQYIIRMNYFFVLGDNRHNSADSRYWGFVPEDHLLGKAVTVWLSIEPERTVIEGLRKERIFSSIK